MKRALVFLISVILFTTEVFSQGGVEIEYLANEGIVITSKQGKVIIDGIHTYYADEYLPLSQDQLSEMMEPNGRYASTKLVLVSHVHGDHFTAKAVSDFLDVHRGAALISSMQVVDSINLYANADLRSRLSVVDHRKRKRDQRFVGRMHLETIGLQHSNRKFKWVQNLGHIVTIDGVKLLHVGDAALSFSNFDKIDLELENIDIAVIPYWYAYEPELLKEYINAGTYILAHISPGDTSVREEFRELMEDPFGNYIIFDQAGQKFSY